MSDIVCDSCNKYVDKSNITLVNLIIIGVLIVMNWKSN